MKRILIISGVIAAFLSLAQNASAQYRPARIHRDRADFVDEHRRILSDSELIDAVGVDIYEETVLGARKQYKSGKTLIWGGVAGMAAGFAGVVYSIVKLNDAGYQNLDLTNPDHIKTVLDNDPSIAAMYLGSSALTSLGGTAFTAGVVLKTIGKKRLNWVEDQANSAKGYTLNIGTTRNGMGLYLNF